MERGKAGGPARRPLPPHGRAPVARTMALTATSGAPLSRGEPSRPIGCSAHRLSAHWLEGDEGRCFAAQPDRLGGGGRCCDVRQLPGVAQGMTGGAAGCSEQLTRAN